MYDGVTVKAPLLLSHSGNELPASIISTGNTILVRHKADGSRTAKGFMAEYRLVSSYLTSALTSHISFFSTFSNSYLCPLLHILLINTIIKCIYLCSEFIQHCIKIELNYNLQFDNILSICRYFWNYYRLCS